MVEEEMVEGRNGGWDSVVWFRKCVCMQWGTEGCGDGRGGRRGVVMVGGGRRGVVMVGGDGGVW